MNNEKLNQLMLDQIADIHAAFTLRQDSNHELRNFVKGSISELEKVVHESNQLVTDGMERMNKRIDKLPTLERVESLLETHWENKRKDDELARLKREEKKRKDEQEITKRFEIERQILGEKSNEPFYKRAAFIATSITTGALTTILVVFKFLGWVK